MTRDEAIEVISQDIPCEYDTDLVEALDMAIEALKAEPRCYFGVGAGDIKPLGDMVEVVRCKDCANRYYDESRNLYYCTMLYGMGDVSDNNYCSFGERKD